MTLDLSRRALGEELMDDPSVTEDDLYACLRDLAHVNRVTLGYRPTIAFFERLRRAGLPARPLRVLDVGSGYGDTLREVSRWAKRSGVSVELMGLDVNPLAIHLAREATPLEHEIKWISCDALTYRPDEEVDVVMSSLFTHHLTDAQIARFLGWMDTTAQRGWFINDLHRHPVPFHSFGLLARLYGWHRFVRHDGPLSIAKGFSRNDWAELLRAARVAPENVQVEWWTPYRLCVARKYERR